VRSDGLCCGPVKRESRLSSVPVKFKRIVYKKTVRFSQVGPPIDCLPRQNAAHSIMTPVKASKRPARAIGLPSFSSSASSSMDDVDLSQSSFEEGSGAGVSSSSDCPTSKSLNQRRGSPVRMRHRAGTPSTSTSASGVRCHKSSKNGRHITNINKINVINNFGMDGSGSSNAAAAAYFSTPWKRSKQSSPRRNPKTVLAWVLLRAILAILILVWIGSMASVMRNVPAAHSSGANNPSKAMMNLSRWKKLSEHIRLGSQAKENMAGTGNLSSTSDGKDSMKDKDKEQPASIYDLSLFNNQSPTDFQLYTPHAPSCSKPLEPSAVGFTLVSQLSHDRLWMVQYHCARWGDHPMSIAVFSDRDAGDIKSDLVLQGCSAEHLTVRTVSKSRYDPKGTEYPVNLLRNLAFSNVKTSHIVYADIDFWPSSDLHATLTTQRVRERFASDPKLATVIPVFQLFRRCREYKDCRGANIPSMPKKKSGLFTLIKKKQASTFDPTNVGGHGSTKYITWRDQEIGTFVDLPCIKSNRYEPYLAFRYCTDLPPFQEGFTGYGKNKMTWVMQLRRAGYLFSQLGGVFLVHYPHLNSESRQEWDKKPKAMEKHGLETAKKKGNVDWASFKRARVDALFLDFKEWLDGTVEDESRVLMCDDALNDDMRLWVHTDKAKDDDEEADDDDETAAAEEEEDDGAYFQEYTDFVQSQDAYKKCQEEHTSDPAECSKAASAFIESSILWSLVGSESNYVGPDSQMEYLYNAEKCAIRFLAFEQFQRNDEGGEGNEKEFSFLNLVADLYTNMAMVEKKRGFKDKATAHVKKALELNPGYDAAQKVLAQIENGEVEEEEEDDYEGEEEDEDEKGAAEDANGDENNAEETPAKTTNEDGAALKDAKVNESIE